MDQRCLCNLVGTRMRKEKIEWYKSQYPQGTRLQLVDMEDPYSPVPSGMRGTVQFVDDAGQVHVIDRII